MAPFPLFSRFIGCLECSLCFFHLVLGGITAAACHIFSSLEFDFELATSLHPPLYCMHVGDWDCNIVGAWQRGIPLPSYCCRECETHLMLDPSHKLEYLILQFTLLHITFKGPSCFRKKYSVPLFLNVNESPQFVFA